MILRVVASESGVAQTVAQWATGLQDWRKGRKLKPKGLGRPAGGGESPVGGRGASWPGS